jgi:trehalose 6-phosphate phosphatase
MLQTSDVLDRWVAEVSNLWLFLDYDGTLADFSLTPDLVEVNIEVVNLIRELAAQPRLRIAVISGRTLKIVRKLLPVEGIFLAGVYGLEMQPPSGPLIYRENIARIRPFLEKIKPGWEELISGQAGFFLEDKGWTLAIHADKAERSISQKVLARAMQVAEEVLPLGIFRWFVDDTFLEVAPLQAHKGKAVGYLFGHYPLADSRLLYIGDDDKDEEAFETVHAFGGINILVSERAQPLHFNEADYILASPASVRDWLRRLLQRFEESPR